MKRMKVLFMSLMILAVLVFLIGCSSNKPSGSSTQAAAETAEKSEAAEETAALESDGETAAWNPEQPIHIVVQAEAGAGPDLFVRTLQPYLQEELGVAIVVENAPGSGGQIACNQVWKAKPNGYTLLSMSSPLTTVTQISKNCDYNVRDFGHIISFDTTPYVIIVKKGSPINSIDTLIETSKTQKLSNSNSGIGGAMYLQSVIMKEYLGIEYDEVPFNGANPCMLAVMSGDVTFSVLPYDSAIDNQEEVTILAIFNDERIDFLPEVPTMKELGYDFPCLTMRRGIVAPPGTPDEITERLIDAFDKAVKNPSFLEWSVNSGISIDVVLGENYQKNDEECYDTVMEFKDYLQ